ncbi:cholesterol side-chain cleavage enzyme, mitochondrial isoform X1 [Danio rerio]|uniref:Cholesterol side-chain cleavage enzyme, mitochondrial n=4 Tax=Danio rerio TaxID=7955 RepID=Q7SYJ6_DANRE|nr:cholesterol side-chain cleavage enzyme, mitochondrial [Danio rerio]AAH54701.1 Cytochrome P450, subfamily XIA, polypeptide 1 [Danio rerio]|eukprot:NP_694485.2 cytochrome P450, family 11, subfamily A, polypeptide 1 [Danio rerio]
MARWNVTFARLDQSLSSLKNLLQVKVTRSGRAPQNSTVQPFNKIPGRWRNSLLSVLAFTKMGGLRNVHRIMVHNFKTFGPIYREKVGIYDSVYIIKPEDGAILFKAEGHHPNRINVDAWTAYRDYRNQKYGVLLKEGKAWKTDRMILNKELLLPKLQGTFVPLLEEVGQDFVARVNKQIERSGQKQWTTDLTHDLFKFSLESVSAVLYGERLGLLLDNIDPEFQHFIDCVSVMFKTTSPMLYLPPGLLRSIGSNIWKNHVEAWDGIFNQADRYIQNIFKQWKENPEGNGKYPGVLAILLMQDKLSIEDIKASVTELMAGGVDSVTFTLLWTLYELARQPDLQDELRAEISAARIAFKGDMVQMVKMIPLLKAALKETLRLHPVAMSLPRFITEDTVIQNYHIPAGTLVQLGVYAMGRDHQFFPKPEQYCPSRWISSKRQYFKSLGFGFGPRQCLGRRIAETEMQIFLIHMLENFRIEKQKQIEVRSKFELLLMPEKPIMLTIKPLNASR